MRREAAAVLLVVFAACAGASSILGVHLAPAPDPESGLAFRIERVTDRRVFQRISRDSRLPSAEGGLPDAALALRIVARRTVGGNRLAGNLLLPEGRTVEDLVAEALTRGFREAGYRVLPPDAPGRERAFPIEADVEALWGRLRQRKFSNAMFDFETRVRVRAPVGPFRGGSSVRGRSRLTRGGISNATWELLIENGLADLAGHVRERLTATEAIQTAP